MCRCEEVYSRPETEPELAPIAARHGAMSVVTHDHIGATVDIGTIVYIGTTVHIGTIASERLMTTIDFAVNTQAVSLRLDPATPLVYVLRNQLGLTGAKLGCGLEQCGACAVLVDG